MKKSSLKFLVRRLHTHFEDLLFHTHFEDLLFHIHSFAPPIQNNELVSNILIYSPPLETHS